MVNLVDRVKRWINNFLWVPLKETTHTVVKKRDGHKRAFVLTLFFIYALYWLVIGLKSNEYIYFLKVICMWFYL